MRKKLTLLLALGLFFTSLSWPDTVAEAGVNNLSVIGDSIETLELGEMTSEYAYVESQSSEQIELLEDLDELIGGSLITSLGNASQGNTSFGEKEDSSKSCKNDIDDKIETISEFSSGRLLMGINKSVDGRGAVAATKIYSDGYVVLQYKTANDASNAYDYYKNLDEVDYVQVDKATVSIADYNSWGYSSHKDVSFAINLDAFLSAYNGKLKNSVKVAVIDTGIGAENEVFDGKFDADDSYNFAEDWLWTDKNDNGKKELDEIDFNYYPYDPNDYGDKNGHGTHCAGTVAEGTPENVKVFAVRALNNTGSGYNSWITEAIRYAVDSGADVISMSLGGNSPDGDPAEEAAITYAHEKGTICCAAAGNEAMRADYYSPANAPYTITVGALSQDGDRADFSNWGDCVDIFAPGDNIKSAVPDSRTRTVSMSGTSMATPHVAAVAALLKCYDKSITYDKALWLMKNSATRNGYSKDAVLKYHIETVSGDEYDFSTPRLILGPKTLDTSATSGRSLEIVGESSVAKGSTTQLSTKLQDTDGVFDVTWSSDNPEIATVDRNGTVTGVALGNTQIVATLAKDTSITASFTITVDNYARGIELNKDTLEMQIGTTEQLEALPSIEGAILPVLEWTSSTPEVATVDSTGLVTAKLYGSTVITVSGDYNDNSFYARCKVDIKAGNSGTCGNNLTWEIDSDGNLTISGTGPMYNYSNNSGLISPFKNRNDIKTVTIGSGVKTIGGRAFDNCGSLKSVYIPRTVAEIGSYAFGWNEGEHIDDFVIYGNSYPVKKYATENNFSFEYSYQNEDEPLTSGSCGENLTWTFDADGTLRISGTGEMTNYDTYGYPAYSTSPFSFSFDIKKIIIDEGVTSITNGAFYTLVNLTSVELPSSLERIGQEAFYITPSMEEISIPDAVETIGAKAFGYDYSGDVLSEFVIRGDSDVVKSYAEENEFTFCCLNHNYDGPWIRDEGMHWKQCQRCGIDSEKTSHNGNISITKATLTQNGKVTVSCEICGNFEYDILSPTRFVLDNDVVKYAGKQVKPAVTVYDSDGKIIDATNYSVTYSNNVEIGTASAKVTFNGKLYSGSKTVNFKIKAADGKCGDNVWWNLDESGTLTIFGNGEMYTYTYQTSIFYPYAEQITKVIIEEGVTKIGAYVFDTLVHITSVSMANSVTVIEKCAFRRCYLLETVKFPNNLKKISDMAFDNCASLKNIELPDTLTTIEANAFQACSSLRTVVLPNKLKTLYSHTFYMCTNLKSITLPDGMTAIEEDSLGYCLSLKSLRIPDSVTSIGAYAYGYYYRNGDRIPIEDCKILGHSKVASDYAKAYKITYVKVCDEKYYGTPNWNWSSDKTSCTAQVECSVCHEKKNITAVVTTAISKAATCKETGTKTFTATVTINGKTCTDKKTETIPKTNDHHYVESVKKATTTEDGTITNKCEICGNEIKQTISHPDSLVLSVTSYKFSGKAHKPEVTVYDAAGDEISADNYTVTYTDNINVGQATVTVSFESDFYTGSKNCNYNIVHPDGKCGETVWWLLDEAGKLFIVGEGAMYDYDNDEPPYYESADQIKSLVIENGITAIGKYAFVDCINLKEAYIPTTVETVGEKAFGYYLDEDDVYQKVSGFELSGHTDVASDYAAANDFSYTLVCDNKYYDTPVWDWNDDNTECSAFFKCTVCDEEKTVAAVVTSEITNAATCKAKGLRTYTATVLIGGKRYTDSTTEDIPISSEHAYSNEWKYDSSKHWKECSVCGQKANETAHETTNSIQKATVSADGKITAGCQVCAHSTTKKLAHPSKFVLSGTKYTFDGTAKKPSVTVYDTAGKKISTANYSVTYKNNVLYGTASATVTFKGDYYSGSKALSFTISQPKMNTPTLENASTGVKISWKKVTGANKYYIYRSTNGGSYTKVTTTSSLSYIDTTAKTNKNKYTYKIYAYFTVSGKTYKSTVSSTKTIYWLTAQKLSSVKNNASKAITASWTKNTKATGYVLQYSTTSDFKSAKSATVTSYKTTSKKITGLTKGKTYYVRVRSYVTVSGTKYYGAWSSSSKVKISK